MVEELQDSEILKQNSNMKGFCYSYMVHMSVKSNNALFVNLYNYMYMHAGIG